MNQDPEAWPPRDVHVSLVELVSHHVREYPDRLQGSDPMGVLTVGPHLVPLVDKVLEVVMRETAGQGANVVMRFDFINPDQPRDGGKLGIAYSGEGPPPEALEDETSELGRLRQLAIAAGGELALRQDNATGLPKIELAFPFWPNRG